MNHDASRNPARIDAAQFAQDAGQLGGNDPLADYRRLVAEASGPVGDERVRWSAGGELRAASGAAHQPWLHLEAATRLPLTCQRCLEPVVIELEVDCWFRFVQDEATAELEDETADEDVLALGEELNLRQLIEDELLLALPVVPMHDVCPVDVKLSVADPAFEEAASPEHPFAGLERLRGKSE